jgi:chromosome segregation ATPase
MQGSSMEHLRMFRKLCGLEALKNVLLVTTFWDTVSDTEGRRREQELSTNNEFWGRMIQKGSQMKRWSQSSHDEAAREILSAVVPSAKLALQAQVENFNTGKVRSEFKVAQSTLEATRVELKTRIEQERSQLNERLNREKRQVLRQHEREKERLKRAAAQERQIAEDARLAAEWEEIDRVQMANFAEKQQLQRQIQQTQEEGQRANKRFAEEEARIKALKLYYKNFKCNHGDAEAGRRCDRCRAKLHKKRTHYFREFTIQCICLWCAKIFRLLSL